MTELSCDLFRLFFKTPMGESNYAVASDLHCGVTSAIALECGTVTVVGKAICLNHQAVLSPESIDLPPKHLDIHLWKREVVVVT
jgi:hypothetical protein